MEKFKVYTNEIAKHIYEKNGFMVDDKPLFIAMRLGGANG